MPSAEIEIINKLGLHARASAKLSQLAAQFPCEIFLSRNGRQINAKSIMGVMMLAAGMGRLSLWKQLARRLTKQWKHSLH